jgi:hypothetical protein
MGRTSREKTNQRNRTHRTDDEIGIVKKDWRNRIRVALVYPNQYQVGITNLGFQTVYHLLNQMEAVLCERGPPPFG